MIGPTSRLILLLLFTLPALAQQRVGIFDASANIGIVNPPGTVRFDRATRTYTLTAAGDNMWYAADSFFFVYKKFTGDLQFTADIAYPVTGGRPHRKAALLLRQTLAPDAVYADAAIHGSGMTALQYRRTPGENTADIELNIDLPQRVRLVRRGDEITLFLSLHGEPLHQAGASIHLHLVGFVYVGLGVCSHDAARTEAATFSHVELIPAPPLEAGAPVLFSSLQTIQTDDRFRRAMMIRTKRGVLGQPNWTHDGKFVVYNRDGKLYRLSATGEGEGGGPPVLIDPGVPLWCDDDHVLSPDDTLLAVSCGAAEHQPTSLYILPLAGGPARRLTQISDKPALDAHVHGWSPDGRTLVFTGKQDGHTDIYIIPATGGTPARLTQSGSDDAADFTPDGAIVFQSGRSGALAQIWRMKPDGSETVQLTHDPASTRFPHVSPDGKQLVYVSRGSSAGESVLRLIDLTKAAPARDLVYLTLLPNTGFASSWAPDSQHLAFTTYLRLPSSSDGPQFPIVLPRPDTPSN